MIVDDLIATAGTLIATTKLVELLGGDIVECALLVELPELKGKERMEKTGHKIFSLIQFEGH